MFKRNAWDDTLFLTAGIRETLNFNILVLLYNIFRLSVFQLWFQFFWFGEIFQTSKALLILRHTNHNVLLFFLLFQSMEIDLFASITHFTKYTEILKIYCMIFGNLYIYKKWIKCISSYMFTCVLPRPTFVCCHSFMLSHLYLMRNIKILDQK